MSAAALITDPEDRRTPPLCCPVNMCSMFTQTTGLPAWPTSVGSQATRKFRPCPSHFLNLNVFTVISCTALSQTGSPPVFESTPFCHTLPLLGDGCEPYIDAVLLCVRCHPPLRSPWRASHRRRLPESLGPLESRSTQTRGISTMKISGRNNVLLSILLQANRDWIYRRDPFP